MKKFFSGHIRSVNYALSRMVKIPVDNFLNILLISVVISILITILMVIKNSVIWEQNNISFPQIIVFFNDKASHNDILIFEDKINSYTPKIFKNYNYISKEDGIKDLKTDKQLNNILSDITDNDTNNPLSDVMVINTNTTNIKNLNQFIAIVNSLNMVQHTEMDKSYAEKINDLTLFIRYIASFLQLVFILLFLLTIYNMVRMQMMLSREEILVSRLIGANNSFIRRPLAYYALFQVIIGYAIAYFLVNIFIKYLSGLFLEFNSIFGKEFVLTSLSFSQSLNLFISILIFTYISVLFAVNRVLKK